MLFVAVHCVRGKSRETHGNIFCAIGLGRTILYPLSLVRDHSLTCPYIQSPVLDA